MTGFEHATTGALRALRRNLLRGLDRVAGSVADGTFHQVRSKGAAPPAQAGHVTLALLDGVDAELMRRTEVRRGDPPG